MKKIALLILVCIFLLACNLPFTVNWKTPTPSNLPSGTAAVTEQVMPTAAPTEAVATAAPTTAPTAAATQAPLNGTEFNIGGVYMVIPPCMATSTTGTLVQAVPYDENNGPMEYYPQHRKYTFQGYPLSGKFFSVDDPNKTGGLVIYPVAEYAAMNQYIAQDVTDMQTLLTAKPQTPNSIPVLGIFGAAQVFRAQVKYSNFQNGEGVRFLTEYAQYYAPANNFDLFYTFQGITTDGKYWVSVILPINAAYLQDTYNSTIVPAGGIAAPAFDDANFDADMNTYYTNMINKFNTTPDGEFTPGLNCLDQFIQSLQINDPV